MKLDNIIIRKAVLADIPTLKQFEQKLIKFERPFAPNLKEDPISYYDLEDYVNRNDVHLLVAEVDNTLVGSGYALIKKSAGYKKPDQYAYLGFMYVAPDHRGKGINGKITQQLMDWATSKHISEIQLDVYAANESAIKAYAKSGFIPDLLKMRVNTSDE